MHKKTSVLLLFSKLTAPQMEIRATQAVGDQKESLVLDLKLNQIPMICELFTVKSILGKGTYGQDFLASL